MIAPLGSGYQYSEVNADAAEQTAFVPVYVDGEGEYEIILKYKLNGNRVDRFVAATAYLSGSMPSVIMGRGYCTGMALTAYDVVGDKLVERWAFDTGHNSNVWLRCGCLMFFNKSK